MFDRIQKWADKPFNLKLFFVLVVTMALSIILPWFLEIYDNDIYFLIATGREIIENGLPTTNIWTIDNSDGFVTQQWLYAVALAAVSEFGAVGCFLFFILQFIVFSLLLVHFFRLKKVSTGFIIFALSVICLFSKLYAFNLRPQLITLILLLIECIALEHYRLSGKAAWLILLPVSMLLEINLHGSMWPMHFAVLLAYVVPAFYLKTANATCLTGKVKPVAIAFLSMCLMTIVNPYGFDNITYIIKSFTADTFDYLNIVETQPSTFFSTSGLCIIVNVAFVALCLYFKTIGSTSLNMTLGLTFMMMMFVRNQIFEPIALMYLLADTYAYIKDKNIDFRKDITRAMGCLLMCFVVFFGADCVIRVTDSFSSTDPMKTALQSACNYIKEQDIENPRIFTGFNFGGYFEWQGFTNVYMDARPELYTSDFTGDRHILSEYYTYCISGIHSNENMPNYTLPVKKAEIDAWFDGYDFDFVCVSNASEVYLASYMESRSDYSIVSECFNENYVLYERVSE